ncbi:hypothetical protein [Candidatus Nitrosotalea sp. FS]|uniref:hypothetical protein n=1 Tax=Candidatus Nitrosotalea sp. FS TaxID=2341021 RepID=UPI00140863D5|nr:hypothetical protein [Candidatus Nitrosotalea sp. FS]
MVFRFRKIFSGGPVSKNRVIFATISYFGISMFTVFSSFQVGVSIWYVFAYAGVLVGATYLSHRLVKDSIKVWRSDDGKIHAKGGNIPYVIWIVGLVSRFALGYVFIGPDYLMTAYGSQKTLSTLAIEVTLIVDLIMMLGVGTLAGRNINLISKIKHFTTEQKL